MELHGHPCELLKDMPSLSSRKLDLLKSLVHIEILAKSVTSIKRRLYCDTEKKAISDAYCPGEIPVSGVIVYF